MSSEPVFTDLTELARRARVPKRELDRIVRRLVKIYDPLRVYLFGSFSWGTPHWNSDLDFYVVVATDEEAKRDKGYRAFRDFERRYTEFFLDSKSQFEKMISNPATMEHKIHHEADVLYTKPDVVFDETQPLCREEQDILRNARNALRAAKMLIDDAEPLPNESLFHVQQSIEVSLRAFRSFHLQGIFKTHELEWLRRQCAKIEPDIKTIEGFTLAAARRITEYYWLRYRRKKVQIPSNTDGIHAEIAIAERVYEFVKHYIETTPPPTEPTIVPNNDGFVAPLQG